MSSFGETNVNNYNLDSMDNAHDTNIIRLSLEIKSSFALPLFGIQHMRSKET